MDPGCIEVVVYKILGAPHVFCYNEIWESESALRNMLASKHFSQLASLMELSSEPPVCQFRFINDVQGIEFAARARGSSIDMDL